MHVVFAFLAFFVFLVRRDNSIAYTPEKRQNYNREKTNFCPIYVRRQAQMTKADHKKACTHRAKKCKEEMTQFAGFPVDLHVRGTGPQACATADTFVLVAVNTQQIKQVVLCKPQRNRHSFKQKISTAVCQTTSKKP